MIKAAAGETFYRVDLARYFNNDGISFRRNTLDGDFDGNYATYPAEELPPSGAEVMYHGIPFVFPDKSDGKNNNVIFLEQAIQVESGCYDAMYILGAADYGSFEDSLTLVHEGIAIDVPVRLTDWCEQGNPRYGEKLAVRCSKRHCLEGDDGWLGASIWLQVLPLMPRRKLKAIVLPENLSMHMFSLTLCKKR